MPLVTSILNTWYSSGISYLVSGLWHKVSGIWHLVSGIVGIWYLRFNLECCAGLGFSSTVAKSAWPLLNILLILYIKNHSQMIVSGAWPPTPYYPPEWRAQLEEGARREQEKVGNKV